MIVIKVGGSKGIVYDHLCNNVAELVQAGQSIVLVHGGSYETNVLSQ